MKALDAVRPRNVAHTQRKLKLGLYTQPAFLGNGEKRWRPAEACDSQLPGAEADKLVSIIAN